MIITPIHCQETFFGQNRPGQISVSEVRSNNLRTGLDFCGMVLRLFFNERSLQKLSKVIQRFLRFLSSLQSNRFNTDTKGTEPSVRFTEVSVLQRQGMYDFWHSGTKRTVRNREVSILQRQGMQHLWYFWDQTNCPQQRGVRQARLDCIQTTKLFCSRSQSVFTEKKLIILTKMKSLSH